MRKKKQKYKTSVINNVVVTSATKREFYQNIDYYKNQGIKSAQRLQEQKNIQSRIKRSQSLTRREAIREAYKKDIEKYNVLGYTLETFVKLDKKIQKWNERVEEAIKKGKIVRTGKISFPIDSKGHINLKKLSREILNLKKTIRDIAKSQKNYVYNNFYEVYYHTDAFKFFQKMYNKIPFIYMRDLLDKVDMDIFYRYDIRDFDDEARDKIWFGWREHEHTFHNLIVSMADYVNDYDVLRWFGI